MRKVLLLCSREGEEVRITYRRGEPLSHFLKTLQDSGVVRNVGLVKLLIRLGGIEKHIKPGVYVFRKGEGELSAYNRLKEGPLLSYFRFTIREGESLKDFIPRFARYGYERFARYGYDRVFYIPTPTS